MVTLIGISGYAQSGKDTLAKHIAARPGWCVLHFGDKLRAACRALNPYVGSHPPGTWWRWAEMETELGYEGAKTHPVFGNEFRRVLQSMGSEVGRDIFGPNVWVDMTMADIHPDAMGYVIPDVRFPNEASALSLRGGIIVRVSRPGVGPQGRHVSEISLDSWLFDIHVNNDGTPSEMYARFRDQLWHRGGS